MAKKRIKIEKREERREFSIIYHELWTDYLGNIGGSGALLYCYLKYLAGQDIPDPCSQEWEREVCLALGMTYDDSHAAWARLQEHGLICLDQGTYVLCEPQTREEAIAEMQGSSLYAEVERLFGRPLSMTEIHLVGDLGKLYSEELLRAAVKVAVEHRALSLPYIKQVLLNWKAKGISTAALAEADLVAFQEEKAKKGRKTASNRKQKDVPRAAEPSEKPKYDEAEIIMKRIKKKSTEDAAYGS